MKTQTEIVVIGGGIAGCSALYHLTREGITDCVLVERDELTSGTTWHSAAQVTNFGPNQTMVGLKTHSIRLYKELADDPDYPINYHHATGGLRLASQQWHMDGYRHFASMARGMGVDFEIIDAEECRRRHPLITTDNLLGALWDPLDGDIDPAQLCQALARRARKAGAEVYRHNPVTGLTQRADDSWIVHTQEGDIACRIVVNAGGYRCNEVGVMMGVEHPVASMEHQYMLTGPLPEIEALSEDFRVPLIRCPTDDFYSRAEKKGLLVGFYEQDCRTWGLDGIDPGFSSALCPDDLDRVTDVMEGAFARLPCLETAGIHSIVNGPITYTPDGLPLVGPIPSRRNAFCIIGLRAGLGEGGGHGWLLAQMIAHGEACYDTWCLDPRRFTGHANEKWTALKAIEDYQNEFRFHRPHEHRPAGRNAKIAPLHGTLKAAGGRFAPVNGWERLDFIAPDPAFEDDHAFRFGNMFDVVAEEVARVSSSVGLTEVNGFTRLELTGDSVLDWLDSIVCSRVPKRDGRVSLVYALNDHGMVKSEATLARFSTDRVWWGAAAAAQFHDRDWLAEHLPADGSITLTDLTDSHTILILAGPEARAVLAAACPRDDVSAVALPWLSMKKVHVGPVAVTAMAVSYSGELAFELHMPLARSVLVHDLLMEAGAPHGIGPFGLRAVESMRLEKGYLHWKADILTEYDPDETGLARFVDRDNEFIGKHALLARRDAGPSARLVTLLLDSETMPAHPGDSILRGEDVVGTVTSAGWGHRTGTNIAYAFLRGDAPGGLEALVLGERIPAKIVDQPLYDPQGERVRGG